MQLTRFIFSADSQKYFFSIARTVNLDTLYWFLQIHPKKFLLHFVECKCIHLAGKKPMIKYMETEESL
jgi:hypothetical protein